MKQKGKRNFKTAFFLIIVLVVCVLAIRTYNGYRFHLEKQTRFMMDTYVTIYAIGPKHITKPAINAAFKRMKEIEEKMNPINENSLLYKFNKKSEPIYDKEIIKLVKLAVDVSIATEGAFDITSFPLSDLWGFSSYSEKKPTLPSKSQIRQVLKNIGYKYLIINDDVIEKDNKNIAIDLGAIAKGYALEQAAEVLKTKNVKMALIDAGGDIYALGRKIEGPWQIGIKAPREEGLLGYLEVEDVSVMGSGDYERFFLQEGKRYHHIFDLKTGYPADQLISITVVYHNPVLADCLATALFVMGPVKGIEFAEAMKGLEVIMVTGDQNIITSSGLKSAIKTIPKTDKN